MSKVIRLDPLAAEALKGPTAQAVENARGQVALWKSRLEAAEKELVAAEATFAPLLATVAKANGLDPAAVRVCRHTEADKQRALSRLRAAESIARTCETDKAAASLAIDAAVKAKDAAAEKVARGDFAGCDMVLVTALDELAAAKDKLAGIVVGAMDLVVD